VNQSYYIENIEDQEKKRTGEVDVVFVRGAHGKKNLA